MSFYEARIIRAKETRIVEFNLMIRTYQRDLTRLFVSKYCYNDKFIYTVVFLKVLITKISLLKQLYNIYFYMKTILKRTLLKCA